MTPMLPIEVVLVSVLVFIVVLVFAHRHALFVNPKSESEKAEPLIQTTAPNRRNQSATPDPVTRLQAKSAPICREQREA